MPNEELRDFLKYHLGLICRHCESVVLDPDKSKGQTYLRGKCPTCLKSSSDPQIRPETVLMLMPKRERKRLAKEAKRAARIAARENRSQKYAGLITVEV